MSQIKCLIVDDEPLAIKLMKRHVNEIPQLELIGECKNALEAADYLQKYPIDLIFLDIQMPTLTGIDFVKSLNHPPAVIFTTAYRNYAVESYELNVVDYLVKPITFNRFFKAVNKFLHQISTSAKPTSPPSLIESPQAPTASFIFVNANKKHIKVEFSQILYVESVKDYIKIHTPQQHIITKEKISEFEHKLPSSFLRVHRSFIINTSKITAYTAHDIEINQHEIPIGGSYKKIVMEKLK